MIDKGVRSKYLNEWFVPAAQLPQLRDLLAANLPRELELDRAPFLSALQVALAAHHPGVTTIKEKLVEVHGLLATAAGKLRD